MKKYLFSCTVLLCIFVLFLGSAWGQEQNLRIGVAVIDVTPPIGVPLAGYGGGKRRLEFPDLDPTNYNVLLAPSKGILDPILAKALIMESGKEKIAIVRVDAIGITQKMVKDIAARIFPYTGIDQDHLTILGTHTHSGPGDMTKSSFWAMAAVDLFDDRIYNPFIEKVSAVLVQAYNQLAPGRIGVGTTSTFELTRNRRGHPGVIDPVIGIYKIEKIDGTPMAILFNFAIHGTCFGPSNLKMSGDVMGYAERYIEKAMAQQNTPVVAMFVNGTVGDVKPAKGGAEGAIKVGEALGAKVLESIPHIFTRSSFSIKVVNQEISFKKAHLYIDLLGRNPQESSKDSWDFLPALQPFIPNLTWKLPIDITDMVPLKFRLQVIRLGNTAIVCVPGEPITNIGRSLKAKGEKLGFSHTFIFGLANGHMGYITDKENFDEGGYEAMMTIYGRHTGEKLVNTLSKMLEKVKE